MNAISFHWCAVACLVLWTPTITVYGAEFVAERSFGMEPRRLDAILAVPLCLAPLVAAAYFALAVNEGLRNCKTVPGKALIALLGISFGTVNCGAWVLAYIWFYLDLMGRDSL